MYKPISKRHLFAGGESLTTNGQVNVRAGYTCTRSHALRRLSDSRTEVNGNRSTTLYRAIISQGHELWSFIARPHKVVYPIPAGCDPTDAAK